MWFFWGLSSKVIINMILILWFSITQELQWAQSIFIAKIVFLKTDIHIPTWWHLDASPYFTLWIKFLGGKKRKKTNPENKQMKIQTRSVPACIVPFLGTILVLCSRYWSAQIKQSHIRCAAKAIAFYLLCTASLLCQQNAFISSLSPRAVRVSGQDAIQAVLVPVALWNWQLHHLRQGPCIQHSLEMQEGVFFQ